MYKKEIKLSQIITRSDNNRIAYEPGKREEDQITKCKVSQADKLLKNLQEARDKRIKYRVLANGSEDLRESHEDDQEEDSKQSVSESSVNESEVKEDSKENNPNSEGIKVNEEEPRKRNCRILEAFRKLCCCFRKYTEIGDTLNTK